MLIWWNNVFKSNSNSRLIGNIEIRYIHEKHMFAENNTSIIQLSELWKFEKMCSERTWILTEVHYSNQMATGKERIVENISLTDKVWAKICVDFSITGKYHLKCLELINTLVRADCLNSQHLIQNGIHQAKLWFFFSFITLLLSNYLCITCFSESAIYFKYRWKDRVHFPAMHVFLV